MGNAAIWWEPRGAVVPRKIDLGRPLTSLQQTDPRDARVSLTPGGKLSGVLLSAYSQIQLVARFTDASLYDEVEAMCNGLKRGGRISLTEDDSQIYAAFAEPWVHSTDIDLNRSPWHLYGGALAVDDRLVVTGPSPRYIQERVIAESLAIAWDSSAFGQVVTTSGRRNEWVNEAWALARKPQFWPVLRMSPNDYTAQLIRHKGQRIVYELTLTLDEDVGALDALSTTPTVTLQGTTDTGKPTLSEAIRLAGG